MAIDSGSEPARARVWLEIDLAALRDNFAAIAKAAHPLSIMTVLKANAYGLGVRPIAESLKDAGAAAIGVAELSEANAIADMGLPVHVLGGLLPEEVAAAVELGIVSPITDLDIAVAINHEARRQGRVAPCHFLVDSGMGRLGIAVEEAPAVIRDAVRNLDHLQCSGIYTHFAHAYGDMAFTAEQLNRFRELLDQLQRDGITFEQIHVANSDGINNVPESLQPPFTMARTGINLYGLFDEAGQRALPLRPVLALKTRLIAIRRPPAGSTVGYGQTYTVREGDIIGTVAAGYADGIPLAISNRGAVSIRGIRCPILGRVSMDYTTVSLNDVADACIGDEVLCLGDDLQTAEWAAAKGTISYEIICSFGNRVARRYINGSL